MNRRFTLAVVLALALVAVLGVGASAASPVPFFNPGGYTFPLTFHAEYCWNGTTTCVPTDLTVNQNKTYTSTSGASGTWSANVATKTVTLTDVSGCIVPLQYNSKDVALEGPASCNGAGFATVTVYLPPVK